jgi:hypothetical protein
MSVRYTRWVYWRIIISPMVRYSKPSLVPYFFSPSTFSFIFNSFVSYFYSLNPGVTGMPLFILVIGPLSVFCLSITEGLITLFSSYLSYCICTISSWPLPYRSCTTLLGSIPETSSILNSTSSACRSIESLLRSFGAVGRIKRSSTPGGGMNFF